MNGIKERMIVKTNEFPGKELRHSIISQKYIVFCINNNFAIQLLQHFILFSDLLKKEYF